MTTTIIFIILGMVLFIMPSIVWNKKYGGRYIAILLLPLRKKYKIISSFGLMLFIVSGLTFMEITNLIEENYIIWIIFPVIFLSNNRIMFEPYHTSEVVDKLDDFCLYLRPFKLSAKYKGFFAKGNTLGIPESIEKLFCDELNKRIAKTYCVGDPNSPVPTTLSASGIYASDDEWQYVVKIMSQRCKAILIRVMDTEGCIWELNHCFEQHINKTIFLVSEDNHIEILKGYLFKKDIDIPNLSLNANKCVAMHFNCLTNQWEVKILKSIKDIKKCLNDFIITNNEINEYCQIKNNLQRTLKRPFMRMEISAKAAHYTCLFFQPLWYIAFNRWPIVWKIIAIVYAICSFVIFFASAIIYDDFLMSMLILVICFIPFSWLAVRITTSFNTWGSCYLSRKANIVLCSWVIVFFILSNLMSICATVL